MGREFHPELLGGIATIYSAFVDRFFADVGVRFRELLEERFGPYGMGVIDAKNLAYAGMGVCATHDYCDANMVMDQAFREIVGCEVDVENDLHVNLWNDAWSYAREIGYERLARMKTGGPQ